MKKGTTQVPSKVFTAIMKVRDSGKTNMFDLEAVKFYLYQNKDYSAIIWVDEHRGDYVNIIFGRFEIVKE